METVAADPKRHGDEDLNRAFQVRTPEGTRPFRFSWQLNSSNPRTERAHILFGEGFRDGVSTTANELRSKPDL